MILTLSIYVQILTLSILSHCAPRTKMLAAFSAIDFNIDTANMATWLKRNNFIMAT